MVHSSEASASQVRILRAKLRRIAEHKLGVGEMEGEEEEEEDEEEEEKEENEEEATNMEDDFAAV